MSRLTWDGTAEPVSRDQILRHVRGQGNIIFPFHLTTSRIGNLTRLIHTLLYVMTIHTPNAWMSLRTQSVHSFSLPHRSLRTAPSRFPNTMRSGNHPPLIRMSAPTPHTSSRAQRRMNAFTLVYLDVTVVRGHPMVWSLALCPDGAKQDPVAYGAEFGVVFLAKGPRTASIEYRVSIALAFTIQVLRQGATFGLS